MNDPRDPRATGAARQRILRYLEEHAEAADTAHGIAAWWLRDLPAVGIDIVEHALKQLVDERLVDRQELPDGTVIYRGVRVNGHQH